MISKFQIEELRDKWQTTELNVAREYVQHVLLSNLFQGLRKQVRLAFKGGTALRIVWGSPRFSEDLDFTGWGKEFHMGETLKETVAGAIKAGIDIKLVESCKSRGGWFAIAETIVYEWPVKIEWNISLREIQQAEIDPALITTPLWSSYSIHALSVDQMVFEKVDALFRRKKPRDFFDIYFALRKRLGIKKIAPQKKKLLEEVKKLNPRTISKELKALTPQSHWAVIKQLPQLLKQELERLPS
jgi:predicted nucleotidyltransferase component of viral defense system